MATMRPRRAGTRRKPVTPGWARTSASKSATWSSWMSMKKNAGTWSGSRSSTWARMAASISATATSTVRPAPSDIITAVVGEPGRINPPRASRAATGRGGGSRRHSAVTASADARSSSRARTAPATNQAPKPRSLAVRMHSTTRASAHAPAAIIDGSRGRPDRKDHRLTEQAAGRTLAGAAQRPQGEGERRQQAECRRLQQRRCGKLSLHRHRQQRRERRQCRAAAAGRPAPHRWRCRALRLPPPAPGRPGRPALPGRRRTSAMAIVEALRSR